MIHSLITSFTVTCCCYEGFGQYLDDGPDVVCALWKSKFANWDTLLRADHNSLEPFNITFTEYFTVFRISSF